MTRWLTLLLLLLLLITATCFRISSNREKREAWMQRTIVKGLRDSVPDGLELVLVNALWRHGDRSPTGPMPGEKTTEEHWEFGGGGWGELSPKGMSQHYKLGEKLYYRYAENNVFLSSSYRAKEIYVHSTNYNRTIISAMSNLYGMYSNNRPGTAPHKDYAVVGNWQSSFVPIPIHTEFGENDFIGSPIPSRKCARAKLLRALAEKSYDYKSANTQKLHNLLRFLRKEMGATESTLNFANIWHVIDNYMIEKIHYPNNVASWYPYLTEEVMNTLIEANNKEINIKNGVLIDGIIDGVDLTLEIPMMKGGPLINDIMSKARGVIQCRLKYSHGVDNNCKDSDLFFRKLKYHVISSHDIGLGAYLAVLGAKDMVLEDTGLPLYAAAIITEFFIDRRSGLPKSLFRILYHDAEDSEFRVITPYVTGCSEDFCPLEVLQGLADKFNPPGGLEHWCNQPPSYNLTMNRGW